MKSITLSFIIVSFLVGSVFGQNAEMSLYFISSNSKDAVTLKYSRYESTWDDTRILYNCLWKLDNDTLALIDTLNYNPKINTHLDKLIHQQEEGWFLIHERDRRDWRYYESHYGSEYNKLLDYFSILSYSGDDSLELKKMNSKNIPFDFDELIGSSFKINGHIIYRVGIDKEKVKYFYYLNKNGEITQRYRPWDINELFVKTEASALERTYQRTRYPGGKDGKLKSGHTEDFESYQDADFQGPYIFKDKNNHKYRGFSLNYQTSDSKYLIGNKDFKEVEKKDSIITYWVLDKINEKWDTFCLHHFYPNFNVYIEEYIYGTGMNFLSYLNDTDSIIHLLEQNTNYYSDSLGLIPMIQTLTGKFFIYHLPTKTFCEFVGSTIDTEVIQIIDDWIYYREYDEIRRMKLDQVIHKFDPGTIELVVKDKYKVPLIHHLFFSKAKALKKEELYLRN